MNSKSKSGKLAGISILSAIAASLCCITPVLALISGATGAASILSWMEPFRPYLLGVTLLVLGFSWYQKLKPLTAEKIKCACEEDEKPPFMQTKKFLAIVTVLAILMMGFPYYAEIFYPKEVQKEVVIIDKAYLQKVEFKIDGMTCEACASHISNEVNKVNGVYLVTPSFQYKNISIQFDNTKTNESELLKTIKETGYKVKNN
ncbi:mercuric transport protein MerTP [Flavobacterium ovatum]|uniref:mercuric transport protein MerTP n=1 Tax=Flavobacterium ovatum TaxID=1928857 RepID=UPI00344BFF92